MLPDPLHPAVVHFPIVLAALLPISALAALWAIRSGADRVRAWAVPVAVALALTGSAWISMETGEGEEERVEAVVGEAALHAHEEAAERFLLFGGVTTLVLGVGLVGGLVGSAGRAVGVLVSLVVLAAAWQVGSAGGELVYVHGAASAYVDADASPSTTAFEGAQRGATGTDADPIARARTTSGKRE